MGFGDQFKESFGEKMLNSIISQDDIKSIPLSQIDFDDTQFEYRIIRDLAPLVESLKKDGQKIPAMVRKKQNKYQLICGFRRARALQEIGTPTIKAFVYDTISDQEAHRISIIENEERKNLNDIDRANAIVKLKNESFKIDDIIHITGLSERSIHDIAKLLETPEIIQKNIERLGRSKAILIHRHRELFPSVDTFNAFVVSAVEKEMSRREIQNHCNRLKTVPRKEQSKQAPMAFNFPLPSNISSRKGGIVMTAETKSDLIDTLENFLELLRKEA
ncbi:MAG: ParB/RepB/Spo0J family partition protein [Desulfobacterales bacterium]|nr:ParB/RepB/Spo0J family partition protein [Desulfobacterales bacterium]